MESGIGPMLWYISAHLFLLCCADHGAAISQKSHQRPLLRYAVDAAELFVFDTANLYAHPKTGACAARIKLVD